MSRNEEYNNNQSNGEKQETKKKKQQKQSEHTGQTNAYTKEADEVLQEYSVDPEKGLSESEVAERREKYGSNKLKEQKKTGILELITKQFKDFLILVLFIAAGISFFIGHNTDGFIILGVILFNATMGFLQEFKAEKAIKDIKDMVRQKALAIRDGEEITLDAEEIVTGDIIVLESGKAIPADARIFEAKNLRTAEAALTGESEPIAKNTDKINEDTVVADQKNMVWRGTHVVKGSGKAVVVKVGEETQIGDIAETLSEMEKVGSNFKRKINRLAKFMAAFAISAAMVVFLVSYFYRGFEFEETLLITIAVLVSSIPEGLPVVVSLVLAIGANRMAKQKAIIREFTATEELGSVTSILSDKTQTITQGVLTVKKISGADRKEFKVEGTGHSLKGKIEQEDEAIEVDEKKEPVLAKILLIAGYCNKASLKTGEEEENGDEKKDESEKKDKKNDDKEKIKTSGDPTEIALLILAEKSGIKKKEFYENVEVLDDLPFNTDRKFRATLIKNADGKKEILVVGAPEKILDISAKTYDGEDTRELNDDLRDKITQKNEEWAEEALRVLALAHLPVDDSREELEEEDVKDIIWTGIVGMIDPEREGVKESIADCKRAGIRVIMVTGDHKKTAAAIASNVGIIDEEDKEKAESSALSEKDVEDLSDEEFAKKVESTAVFARVSPKTKLRIVECLQDKGELIAMTGDGVNDSLALKKADVGIAMGQRGTDVAKDASEIVLSDDNFTSIVNAIREGRIIFKNIKNTSYFLLTTNFASATTITVTLLIGLPFPLTAVQILWVNLVTDGILDVARSTEPGHGNIMDKKPIKKNERILKWEVAPFMLIMVVMMLGLTLLTFNHYLQDGIEMARTGAFLMIAMTQVFNVFNMRDLKQSVFTIGLTSNKWLNRAFIASLLLQFGAVNLPFMQDLFNFRTISMVEFLVITAMASSVLWAGELYKLIKNKYFSNDH